MGRGDFSEDVSSNWLTEEEMIRGIVGAENKKPSKVMLHQQALADAICNVQKTPAGTRYLHAPFRYRGVAGKNGVACDYCLDVAKLAILEYQKILDSLET